jgi:hypothetical protein
MFILHVQRGQVSYSVIPSLLDQWVGVGKEVSKKFGCESEDNEWDGFNAKSVIQVG